MSILYRFSEGVDVGAGRTIHGRALPYGEVAEVSDGRGSYRERFELGAFRRSIAERGNKFKLFVGHDQRRLPLGNASLLEERSDGLYVAFTLPKTSAADDALELVRSEVVSGMSVGFVPMQDRFEGDITVRVEASLREVSLTHAPAYSGTFAGVRSLTIPRISVEVARKRLALIDKEFH